MPDNTICYVVKRPDGSLSRPITFDQLQGVASTGMLEGCLVAIEGTEDFVPPEVALSDEVELSEDRDAAPIEEVPAAGAQPEGFSPLEALADPPEHTPAEPALGVTDDTEYAIKNPDGLILGPLAIQEVTELIRSGGLAPGDPVSLDGGEFEPAEEHPELMVLFERRRREQPKTAPPAEPELPGEPAEDGWDAPTEEAPPIIPEAGGDQAEAVPGLAQDASEDGRAPDVVSAQPAPAPMDADAALAAGFTSPQAVWPDLSGDLAQRSLPSILFQIHREKRDGVLEIERAGATKQIYFQRGAPVRVHSTVLGERFGEMVVQRGLLSQAQLEQALVSAKSHERFLGAELVHLGLLTAPVLFEMLGNVTHTQIINAFTWTTGAFVFEPQPVNRPEQVATEVDPIHMLRDGIARHFDLRRLKGPACLGPLLDRKAEIADPSGAMLQQLKLPPREFRLASKLEGGVTLREMLKSVHHEAHEELRAARLLFLLVVTDVLAFEEEELDVGGYGQASKTPDFGNVDLSDGDAPVAGGAAADDGFGNVDLGAVPPPEPGAAEEPEPSPWDAAPAEEPELAPWDAPPAEDAEPGVAEEPAPPSPWDAPPAEDAAPEPWDAPPAEEAAPEPEANAAAWEPPAAPQEGFGLPPDAPAPAAPAEPEGGFAPPTDAPAPVEPEPEPAAAAPTEQTREQILFEFSSLASRLDEQNYFEVLGLAQDCDEEAVRKAYVGLVKTYHPDSGPGSGDAEVRELKERIFERITEANEVLADTERRQAYIAHLASGATEELHDGDQVDIGPIIASEEKFMEGQRLLRGGRYEQAVEILTEAVELYDGEPAYKAHLAYARLLALGEPGQQAVARTAQELVAVLEEAPHLEDGWMFLGHVYKRAGQMDYALQSFERVLELNRHNNLANSEARVLRKRIEESSKKGKKGLFGF